MNILVPVIVGIAVGLLFAVRREPKPRDIAPSLSPADRQFIADQMEPITKLPLNTAADEDAWLEATRAVMQRLKERFPDVASVVPEHVYHYFDDADIHRKEPSYRVAREARILDFIRLLREEPQRSNQSVELTATRLVSTLFMTKAFSLPAPLAPGGGSSLLSR